MNSAQTSKLRMAQATIAVANTHKPVWQSLKAFGQGVVEAGDIVSQIVAKAQEQESRVSVASAEKAQTFQALVDGAYEVAAAVHACAVASSNKELAARADFSHSDIGEGSDSRVVSRCQDVLSAATENLDSLDDYGVTAAKLATLKKRIEAFQTAASKPRQTTASVSAATKELHDLFAELDGVLKGRLDKLAVQFKDSQPAFYNAYSAARRIVDPASRPGKEGKVVSALNKVPGTKAA